MKELRRILVGLDLGPRGTELTPGSREALEAARWIAEATGAHIDLVHSSASDESFDAVARSFVVVHQGLSERGRAELEGALDDLRGAGLAADLLVVDQRAAQAIALRAQNEAIDLVIVGKRSALDTDRRTLGSVSRRLLSECPAAVWVVKAGQRPQPECILAAAELDAVGQNVLTAAGLFARASQAELHVLLALQESVATQMDAQREELDRNAIQTARQELALRLGKVDAEVARRAKLHVGFDAPSHAILTAEERFGVDLTILGTSSRKGVAGWLLGSTAARMLDRLDGSILAIKPK